MSHLPSQNITRDYIPFIHMGGKLLTTIIKKPIILKAFTN